MPPTNGVRQRARLAPPYTKGVARRAKQDAKNRAEEVKDLRRRLAAAQEEIRQLKAWRGPGIPPEVKQARARIAELEEALRLARNRVRWLQDKWAAALEENKRLTKGAR